MSEMFGSCTDYDFERELCAAIKEGCMSLKTLITQESASSNAKSVYHDMMNVIDDLLCGEGVDMIAQMLDDAEEENTPRSDPWGAERRAHMAVSGVQFGPQPW